MTEWRGGPLQVKVLFLQLMMEPICAVSIVLASVSLDSFSEKKGDGLSVVENCLERP